MAERQQRILHGAAATTTSLGLLGTSLLVVPAADDPYRLPKEMVLRGEAILLLLVLVLAFIYNRIQRRDARWLKDPVIIVALACVSWSFVSTATSLHPHLSLNTNLWVMSAAIITCAVYFSASYRSVAAMYPLLAFAGVNAVVAILQERRIWNPFFTDAVMDRSTMIRHLYTTGFIGNPDDLGAFLVPSAIVAAALLASAKRFHWPAAVTAIVIVFGLIAAQSLTALAATAVGVVIVVVRLSKRTLRWVAICGSILIAIGLISFPRLRARLAQPIEVLLHIRSSNRIDALEQLTSNRIVPLLAAAQMFREHPLTGVGPGCFGIEYYFHKIAIEQAHRSLRASPTARLNFDEAHNDHAQLLATIGLPGYGLFLSALILLALRTGRLPETDERSAFVRACGPSVAAALLVLTLFQFPLELAAPLHAFVFAGALLAGWSVQIASR